MNPQLLEIGQTLESTLWWSPAFYVSIQIFSSVLYTWYLLSEFCILFGLNLSISEEEKKYNGYTEMSTTVKKNLTIFYIHVYKSQTVWYTRCFCLQKNPIMALCAFIVFLNQTVKSSYIVFRLMLNLFQ
jgi:hypothetical protein